MERKRKLPARAAARVEHVAKKRTATPPERSLTPAPGPVPEAAVEEPPLPKSIQAGHPLPTVENAQPDDLSHKDYQSIQESGVLAESLLRSRQKWINDGIFEKYWTKPTKRKGVVKEEPNNPPKDSMTKIGTITINIEPHVLEAIMYAVKDPKPPTPTTNSNFRPIIQYGPPNGVMPPEPQRQLSTAPPPNRPPLASPRGLESVLAAPGGPQPPPHSQAPPTTPPPLRSPALPTAQAQPSPTIPQMPGQAGLSQPKPLHTPSPTPAGPSMVPVAGGVNPLKPPTPAAKPATPTPSGADPIIVTLAERASEDSHLRDLMKRVAVGDAGQAELAHFQKIIDQITIEYKKKGGQQGPSADRLIVDSRTVKYFADEVRAILDIVLASNPNQKGADLRPPPGSDPLVILLVKKSLDDENTKNMVRRVAEGKTKFDDATQLKAILDKLKDWVTKEPKPAPSVSGQTQTPAAHAPEAAASSSSTPARKSSVVSMTSSAVPSSQQALRSKGPPPSFKPDISAIVLEFLGGTGDRYMFPKYSILEYQAGGTQVLASFLIVRKGSKSKYGGDPTMDYYQPVTIRVSSQAGKHLENLARVVAPQDEVKRYMDDIMDNMTRAEYILLAMRLPRSDQNKDDRAAERSETPKSDQQRQFQSQTQPDVLWRTKAAARLEAQPVSKVLGGEEEQYQSFITTVS
ncbi:uncharacterized protein BCR38DRAFT_405938 [Pseudomassariella vexata]|uniref:SWR1-complex protein 3 domain-containing protein n=1 Tax=Pseudomassariella vexata TaxID=1141098 RepID=A0A1Y2EFH1_9PEZI|nr:uncharacterized protein BCR38DRAFT_405938 [Pseudomassariella vexata]ORY70322.1 hypothetical protein BCR38DRAFT_405938 [Pseudomassariella vexata]